VPQKIFRNITLSRKDFSTLRAVADRVGLPLFGALLLGRPAACSSLARVVRTLGRLDDGNRIRSRERFFQALFESVLERCVALRRRLGCAAAVLVMFCFAVLRAVFHFGRHEAIPIWGVCDVHDRATRASATMFRAGFVLSTVEEAGERREKDAP
jgi:hypothetical protein